MPLTWDTANDKHIGPRLNQIERYLWDRWARYVQRVRPGWESSVRLDGVYPRIGYKVWFTATPKYRGYGYPDSSAVQFHRSLHLPEYVHGIPESDDPKAHIRFYDKMWERVKTRKWEAEWRKELPPETSDSVLREE